LLLFVVKIGVVLLSHIGLIVKEEWCQTNCIRNDITLDEFVIMPNHFHAIIFLGYRNIDAHSTDDDTLRRTKLSNLIRGFKSSATSKIREQGYTHFHWQARYYDHIIRN
jgi:REP element-mobilizing transposase RayT